MESSLQSMIHHLDQALTISSDPPNHPPIQTTHLVHTGERGRPRIEIDHDMLATALDMRRTGDLVDVFGVSARTIRQRALDYGLAEPGEPVFATYQAEDGTEHHYHTSSTAPMSDLSDNDLDNII